MRWLVVLILLLLTAWPFEAQTLDVDRVLSGEPCEMVQSAQDLYVGEVVGVDPPVQPNPGQPFSISVHFAVLERFKTIGPTRLGFETLTSSGFAWISVGQRYLVHVRSPGPDDSFLYADQIATLIPLGKAQPFLDYVRRSLKIAGEIRGYVEDAGVASTALFSWAPNWAYFLSQALFPVDWQQKLLRSVRLRLSSEDGAPRFATSNGSNRFRFGDLRVGFYQLSIDDPHLTLRVIDSRVRVVPGGCIDLYLKPLVTPVVMGRVSREHGLPRFGLQAHLFASRQTNSSTPQYSTEIHGPGWFEFSAVAPGDYLLAVDAPSVLPPGEPQLRRYYYGALPGKRDAIPVHVEAGPHPAVIAFRLPPAAILQ